jgi:hypothetical protein
MSTPASCRRERDPGRLDAAGIPDGVNRPFEGKLAGEEAREEASSAFPFRRRARMTGRVISGSEVVSDRLSISSRFR